MQFSPATYLLLLPPYIQTFSSTRCSPTPSVYIISCLKPRYSVRLYFKLGHRAHNFCKLGNDHFKANVYKAENVFVGALLEQASFLRTWNIQIKKSRLPLWDVDFNVECEDRRPDYEFSDPCRDNASHSKVNLLKQRQETHFLDLNSCSTFQLIQLIQYYFLWIFKACEIWGAHDTGYDAYCLLERDAV